MLLESGDKSIILDKATIPSWIRPTKLHASNVTFIYWRNYTSLQQLLEIPSYWQLWHLIQLHYSTYLSTSSANDIELLRTLTIYIIFERNYSILKILCKIGSGYFFQFDFWQDLKWIFFCFESDGCRFFFLFLNARASAFCGKESSLRAVANFWAESRGSVRYLDV